MRPVLEAINITKTFSGVQVLKEVTFDLMAGEVHALVGENGAGKSTLMKVLAGLHAPDFGSFRVNGHAVLPGNPHASLSAGIAMIYQELSPFLDLSIAENIFMGLQPANWFGLWIHRAEMHRRAGGILRRLNTPLSTSRKL